MDRKQRTDIGKYSFAKGPLQTATNCLQKRLGLSFANLRMLEKQL
jgi:hypothetical protein